MAERRRTTHDQHVLPSSDSLSLVCNDCGAETALARGDSAELLDGLHAFLRRHSFCSYDVSLTFASSRRQAPVPTA